MSSARLRPWLLTVSTAAAVVAAAAGLPNPARAVLVFWFLVTCPGMAVVPLLGVRQPATELTLGIAGSLALDTLVAETMVLTKLWSPAAGLAILAAVSLCGAAVQLRLGGRHAAAPRRRPAGEPPAGRNGGEGAHSPVWNVEALGRLVAGRAVDDGGPERSAYLHALWRYARAGGHLPPEFDPVVREVNPPDGR